MSASTEFIAFGPTKILGNQVEQREFLLPVNNETVPSVFWVPRNRECTGLVAFAHGGSQHKKYADIRNRAIRYAENHGWAGLAIDAPGHGDRISREQAEALQKETLDAVNAGGYINPLSPEEKAAYVDNLAGQAVPEWQGALDAVHELGWINEGTPAGFWGVSMGSWIGIPLLAVESRFCCAVLGLSQLHPVHSTFKQAASRIDIPLRYVLQWDDPIRTRQYGLDLFDAFGSTEKSMHINPGGHMDTPEEEMASWEDFYRRFLPVNATSSDK